MCGLCAGRAARPKRFQLGPREPACRYCGRVGEGFVCTRCEKIRAGFETAHMSRHTIADRRGWTGPPTIGDDELWITIIQRLREADHRRLALDEKDVRKANRDARLAKFEEAAAGPSATLLKKLARDGKSQDKNALEPRANCQSARGCRGHKSLTDHNSFSSRYNAL